jgi:histidinol phosphatase-like enzyme
VDFDEVLYGGDDIEDGVDHSKWRTFTLLKWVKHLNRLVDLDEIVYIFDNIEDDLCALLLIL